MSFESGRKLGLTARLIEVIMPVISVIATIFLVLSLIATILDISTEVTILLVIVGIITFVGFILFFVAMHSLSKFYNEPGIFKNVLYGFIINILGAVIVLSIELATIVTSIGKISQGTVAGTAGSSIIQFIILFLLYLR